MDVAHVALWVSEMDRAVEFYTELGLERQWSFTLDGVENVYVGGDHGELQLRHDPDRTTPIAPNRADVDHVALTVDDTEAMVERATEQGATVVTAPTVIEPADAYVAFVEDPEGYVLEFVEPLESSD
ncbi:MULTISPECIES: VOC family protein [Halomicrobium]|uniref:Glyoxalase/bleomycin resistance protein/dioxygenase n=2 Tax=Halomicrobium mukohataei TaxID=57705 RepID=C7P260_HALMD|nr:MULTISPECIES: VOC family protein [Halomicrobium]ACV47289.1 Glyoxalase/bleomycin resistance protein/dioxygenase [Halomicrobium mukohataei DSM 12286]QCD65759.1 VOC family protein [Halomicrobium mukohataei]QFR20564.1 VOC family protein [Halomicrobium sp. ZPS1]